MLGCLSRDPARRRRCRGPPWGGAWGREGRGFGGRAGAGGGASAGARSAEHRPAAGAGVSAAQEPGGSQAGTGGTVFPPRTTASNARLPFEAIAPCTPELCFSLRAGPHPAPRSTRGLKYQQKMLFWQKKKKKAPHGDTTCSRKTFPLFFSWHGLRQLPERIGANSKKPLCPSPSRHQSRDNSSCERRASLKGPPGIPGGVPSALTTSLPALALRNASPRSVRRPASHPLA